MRPTSILLFRFASSTVTLTKRGLLSPFGDQQPREVRAIVNLTQEVRDTVSYQAIEYHAPLD